MIDWVVSQLFKWEKLRLALFSEVNFYNSISRTLEDPESMKIVNTMWCESDGWRGWNIKDDGTYYFHDTPEKWIGDIMDILFENEKELGNAM